MKKEKEERDKIKWCKYVLYENYDFEVKILISVVESGTENRRGSFRIIVISRNHEIHYSCAERATAWEGLGSAALRNP